jgi:uncharacterized protein (DUF58 family)
MSMNYQGGGLSTKGVYGAQLIAALSWTLLSQGEAVGLITYGDEIDHYLPASSKRDHFWRIIDTLETGSWLTETNAVNALMGLPARLPPKGVIFLLTDGFDFSTEEGSAPQLPTVARALKRHGYHVVLLHLLDPHEMNFPFDELSLFEGLEGEDHIKVDPEGVRRAYLQEFSRFRDEMEKASIAGGVTYFLNSTDQPLSAALLGLLERVS